LETALTVAGLLKVWESGIQCSPLERTLLLLEKAFPEESWDDLAALPIGRRDERLLKLRESIFGPTFVSLVSCPKCGERLELSFTVDDVRVTNGIESNEEQSLQFENYKIDFRLPNSIDLADNEMTTREQLLERCMLRVFHNGKQQGTDSIPNKVLDALDRQMGKADPQANVQTELTCPSCMHQWRSNFDIALYMWEEIESWATQTLQEVHLLATSYSWSESAILGMSPLRRQFYLKCLFPD
jgi:hypothetical protein